MSKDPSNAVTTIDEGQPVVTLINIFEVEPADQQQLIQLLERATQEVMKELPGFVSANIHRSLDGKRVANYAQWASPEHFTAMLKNPRVNEHMAAVTRIAKAAPSLYEVTSVHR
jgi:quinol monooxygenase YgiN